MTSKSPAFVCRLAGELVELVIKDSVQSLYTNVGQDWITAECFMVVSPANTCGLLRKRAYNSDIATVYTFTAAGL